MLDRVAGSNASLIRGTAFSSSSSFGEAVGARETERRCHDCKTGRSFFFPFSLCELLFGEYMGTSRMQ